MNSKKKHEIGLMTREAFDLDVTRVAREKLRPHGCSVVDSVDGVHVADFGLNQSYEAVLPRGQHVLSVTTTPQGYRSPPPTQRRVNAEPGATYAFTAFWKNYDEAYLEKNGTRRIITPSNPG